MGASSTSACPHRPAGSDGDGDTHRHGWPPSGHGAASSEGFWWWRVCGWLTGTCPALLLLILLRDVGAGLRPTKVGGCPRVMEPLGTRLQLPSGCCGPRSGTALGQQPPRDASAAAPVILGTTGPGIGDGEVRNWGWGPGTGDGDSALGCTGCPQGERAAGSGDGSNKGHASAFSDPTLVWLPQCGAEPLCQRPPERATGWGQARSPALLCERAPAVLLDPVRWQQPLLQNMGQTRELMCNSCTEAD